MSPEFSPEPALIGLWWTVSMAILTVQKPDGVPRAADWMEDDTLPDAALHEAVPAIAALGVSPIVRIPDLQGWMIKRQLLFSSRRHIGSY
jgi:4-hydroxy-2-oxoheptanedioate aldolase